MADENQKSNPSQDQPAESLPTLPSIDGNPPQLRRRRRTWPDLVGLSAEEAERKIKEELPGAHVQVVPPNCFVTMDFKEHRVRLYVDSTGKVERAPTIG